MELLAHQGRRGGIRPGLRADHRRDEGKGITDDIDSMLASAIDRYEDTSGPACPCDPNAMIKIGSAVNELDKWSAICGNPGLTNSYVSAPKGMWISRRRGSCECFLVRTYPHKYKAFSSSRRTKAATNAVLGSWSILYSCAAVKAVCQATLRQ